MVDRDAYVEKMQAKLDEWDAEIDKLSAKANAAQADAKLEYDRQIEALKKQREEALQRLNDLQSASEDAWRDMKAGVDAAWDEMADALKKAAAAYNPPD